MAEAPGVKKKRDQVVRVRRVCAGLLDPNQTKPFSAIDSAPTSLVIT